MAHFAVLNSSPVQHNELGEVYVVESVVVVANSKITDKDGIEREELGADLLKRLFSDKNFLYKRCSYNAKVNGYRNEFPGKGFYWSEIRGAFVQPKPVRNLSQHGVELSGNWVFDETSLNWKFIKT